MIDCSNHRLRSFAPLRGAILVIAPPIFWKTSGFPRPRFSLRCVLPDVFWRSSVSVRPDDFCLGESETSSVTKHPVWFCWNRYWFLSGFLGPEGTHRITARLSCWHRGSGTDSAGTALFCYLPRPVCRGMAVGRTRLRIEIKKGICRFCDKTFTCP